MTSLRIVELAGEIGGLTLTDVIDRLDVAKSTAHLHLTTLVDAGYLEKNGPVYELSLKFFHLGEHVRRQLGPWDAFESIIGTLADETREEAVLVVESDDRLISIYSVLHDRVSHNERTVGQYDHLHNSATGKAILACLSDDRCDTIVNRWNLPSSTEHTITSRESLRTELQTIQERGFAISNQEYMDGMIGLAQAVKWPTGEVFGAVGISGPTYRLGDEELRQDIVKAIDRAANRLEDVLADTHKD